MSRRLVIIFLALAGLAVGVYLMPRVNPSFAGIPQIGRDQVSRLVQEFLQQRKFDPSGFHCDKVFVHDGTALDYLIDEFGVERVIELGRQDQFPLLYWHYEYYRNAPKDAQKETYSVRVSPLGKPLGFFQVLPDSAAGDSLSEEAALQIARQTLENWPGVQFAEFDLEQSAAIKKTSRKDHKLIFTRRDPSLGEASDLIEVYIAGSELAGVLHKVRVPDRFLAASGIVGGANVLINTFSVVVYVVLLFASLIAFLRKYHEGEIGVRIGLWLGGLVFFALTLAGINMWERMGFGWSFGPISQLYNKLIVMGQQVFFGYVFISLMVLGCWTVGEQAVRADKPRLLSGVDSFFHRQWLTKNIGRELPVGFAFGLMLFGLVQLVMYVMINFFGVLPRLTDNAAGSFDSYAPFYGVVVNIIMAALFDELVFRLFLNCAAAPPVEINGRSDCDCCRSVRHVFDLFQRCVWVAPFLCLFASCCNFRIDPRPYFLAVWFARLHELLSGVLFDGLYRASAGEPGAVFHEQWPRRRRAAFCRIDSWFDWRLARQRI